MSFCAWRPKNTDGCYFFFLVAFFFVAFFFVAFLAMRITSFLNAESKVAQVHVNKNFSFTP